MNSGDEGALGSAKTREERREVASRLRALTGGRINWTGLQCAVFGGTALRSDTVARLAELIEPGGPVPGETCELVGDGMPECEPLPPIVDRGALLELADKLASFSRDEVCLSCAASGQPECSCGVECREAISHSAARLIREACGDTRGGA